MQHFGKGALRVAKNYTKGYSDTQAKVRDATSNDPWGPSGTQMNEIAQLTYNQNDFVEIMEMLDKRLNDKGKNWRHVFKSLTVLDYCLHAGSENVVLYFRDNIYIIKTLKEFQYIDEYGKDQGANVRQKAKDITNLLTDENRLREQRRSRAHMRDRMIGQQTNGEEDEVLNENSARRRPARTDRDDDELRRAIEASKQSLAEEQARQGTVSAEERDLQRAIRLSEEEEEKRNKAVEDSNANALFDDQQQQNLFMSDPTPYATGLQPQYTQIQPQFTSFNPYQQQMQQEAMQAEYLRQQQEWQQQQMLAAQQQAQQEEWLRQQQLLQMQQQQQMQQHAAYQQMQQQQALMAQPTGFASNNPFAAQTQSPAPPMPAFAQNMSPSSSASPSFNLGGTYSNGNGPSYSSSPAPPQAPGTSPSPGPSQQKIPTKADQEHSHLANLLANREDGLDTFGNIGSLRYGHTDAGRFAAVRTGHNPFAAQQQQQQGGDQPFFSI